MMRKKALFVLLFITPFAIFFGRKYLLAEKNVQLNYEDVKEKAISLSYEWLNPSWSMRELEQNCPALFESMKQVDRKFLRCNPEYLKCRFKNSFVDFKSERYPQLGYLPIYKSLAQNSTYPARGIELTLKIKDQEQKIFLENECRKVYLPQRRYLYLHSDTKQKWYWDNFNRHIYVDQFMIRNQDIFEWKTVTQQPYTSTDQPYAPATNLSLTEMKNYCSFVGSHLLQAHIYDAAAIYPKQPDESKPESITAGPYPWSTKKLSEELFQYQKNPKRPLKVDKVCTHLMSKECALYHQTLFGNQAFSSWSGMNDLMNGVSEVFDNPIEPHRNVAFFDKQLPATSTYFQLGKRIHWDEEDRNERNFPELETHLEINWPIGLGFRCMTYDWEAKNK